MSEEVEPGRGWHILTLNLKGAGPEKTSKLLPEILSKGYEIVVLTEIWKGGAQITTVANSFGYRTSLDEREDGYGGVALAWKGNLMVLPSPSEDTKFPAGLEKSIFQDSKFQKFNKSNYGSSFEINYKLIKRSLEKIKNNLKKKKKGKVGIELQDELLNTYNTCQAHWNRLFPNDQGLINLQKEAKRAIERDGGITKAIMLSIIRESVNRLNMKVLENNNSLARTVNEAIRIKNSVDEGWINKIVKIFRFDNNLIPIMAVYAPPGVMKKRGDEIGNYCTQMAIKHGKLIVAGDFNQEPGDKKFFLAKTKEENLGLRSYIGEAGPTTKPTAGRKGTVADNIHVLYNVDGNPTADTKYTMPILNNIEGLDHQPLLVEVFLEGLLRIGAPLQACLNAGKIKKNNKKLRDRLGRRLRIETEGKKEKEIWKDINFKILLQTNKEKKKILKEIEKVQKKNQDIASHVTMEKVQTETRLARKLMENEHGNDLSGAGQGFWKKFIAEKLEDIHTSLKGNEAKEYFKEIQNLTKHKIMQKKKLTAASNNPKLRLKEEFEKFYEFTVQKFDCDKIEPMEEEKKTQEKIEPKIPIDKGLVEKAMNLIARNKAMAFDGIDPRILELEHMRKKLTQETIELLENKNHHLESRMVGRMVMIPKKENSTDPEHMRPLVINPIHVKAIEAYLKLMMEREGVMEKVIHHGQLGFMPSKNTQALVVAVLDNMVKLKRMKKDKIKGYEGYVALFLDYRAAFDSIPQEEILRISEKIFNQNGLEDEVEVLQRLFQLYKFTIEGDPEQRILSAKKGTPQGSMVSPWLFNLCINGLAIGFDKKIKKGDQLTNIYLWADDVVMIMPFSKIAQVLELLEEIKKNTGLEMNKGKGKTELMWITKPKKQDKKITSFNGIGFVKKYEYLGFKIYSDLNAKNEIKAVNKKIGWVGSMSGLVKRLHLKLKRTIVKTIIRAMVMYHVPMIYQLAETWWKGKADTRMDKLDSRIRNAVGMMIPASIGRSKEEIKLILGMMSSKEFAQYRIAAIFPHWYKIQERNGLANYKIEQTIFQKLIQEKNEWLMTDEDKKEIKNLDFSKLIRQDAEEMKRSENLSRDKLTPKVIDIWRRIPSEEIKKQLGWIPGGKDTPYKENWFSESVWKVLTNHPFGKFGRTPFGENIRKSCVCAKNNYEDGYTAVNIGHMLRCDLWRDEKTDRIWEAANNIGLANDVITQKVIGEIRYHNSTKANESMKKIEEQELRNLEKYRKFCGYLPPMTPEMKAKRRMEIKRNMFECCFFDLEVLYRIWESKLHRNIEEIPERSIQNLKIRDQVPQGQAHDNEPGNNFDLEEL